MSKTKFIDKSIKDQDKLKQVEFKVNKSKGAVTCKLHDSQTGMTFIGVTKVKDGDQFEERVGRNIAFCKARLQEIGYDISSLKYYLRKVDKMIAEVKRQSDIKLNKLKKDRNIIISDLAKLSN